MNADQRGLRIAIMAHMYHSDQFQHFRRLFEMVPEADLFLTTTDADKIEKLRATFSGRPGHTTAVPVMNRGRDVAPKLISLAPYHQEYDLVLHVHTKAKDPVWRDHILKRVLGSRRQVKRILRMFAKDARLGMVGPEYFPPSLPWVNWAENRAIGEGLLMRMGIDPQGIKTLDFPAGSMFWARPAALQPLFDLRLSVTDFPEEPIGVDGTLAHAIERTFYLACEKAGYRWEMVAPFGHQTGRKLRKLRRNSVDLLKSLLPTSLRRAIR
jgi:O-antigen biosynthesis protein